MVGFVWIHCHSTLCQCVKKAFVRKFVTVSLRTTKILHAVHCMFERLFVNARPHALGKALALGRLVRIGNTTKDDTKLTVVKSCVSSLLVELAIVEEREKVVVVHVEGISNSTRTDIVDCKAAPQHVWIDVNESGGSNVLGRGSKGGHHAIFGLCFYEKRGVDLPGLDVCQFSSLLPANLAKTFTCFCPFAFAY